jgi:putative transposase
MTKITKFKLRKKAHDLWVPNSCRSYYGDTNSWYNYYSILNDNPKSFVNSKPKIKQIKEEVLRAEKTRIYPDKNQTKLLLQIMDKYRKIYNETISIIKSIKFDTRKTITDFKTLRGIVNLTGISNNNVLYEAIRDVCKAFDSAFSALDNGAIKHFTIKYKKKNCKQLSFVLPYGTSKKINTFLPETFKDPIKSDKPINGYSRHCRVTYNQHSKKFYICIPKEKSCKTSRPNKIIALDPGIRTFLTGYSDKDIVVIGDNVKEKLTKLHKNIDKKKKQKKGKIEEKESKERYKKRIRRKIKNMVDDLHWKTAKHLCKNNDVILLGNMSTSSIISNKKNLDPMTKRNASALSHYTFMQRLKSKAEEYNVDFRYVDESYTSITCGRCSKNNNNLPKGFKIFKCSCGYILGRDINGARNILIKNISCYREILK